MVAEFKDLVQKSTVRIDEAAWQQDQPFIRAMIRFEIDVDLFGVEVARKNLSRQDPQLQFALTLFPEAEALLRARAGSHDGATRSEVTPKSQRPTPKSRRLGSWTLGVGTCE